MVLCARSIDQLQQVADGICGAGGEAHAVACDVTDPEAVSAMAETALRLTGGVDILVNNAGIALSAPLKRLTLTEWNQVLSVNTTGTFLCTRALVPNMLAREWGRVINVASVAGLVGGKYISAYVASKHAVIGFTRSIALEVASRGVTVNAICPAFVRTSMTRESLVRITRATGISEDEALQALVRANAQGRLIEPEEVAYAVCCLADERAGGINGQAIAIDGGGPA